MWQRISLRRRTYLLLTGLVMVTLAGALFTVWYTYRMEALLAGIVQRDIGAFRTAEALETALINQKGFVSYYFLDEDPDWLRQLGEYRQIFRERLKEAQSIAREEAEQTLLARIESEYDRYIHQKDAVIDFYKARNRQAGARLHQAVRQRFFRLLDLCESYKLFHNQRIEQAQKNWRKDAARIRGIAAAALLLGFLFALLLAMVLMRQILGPLRQLARATGDGSGQIPPDEVQALSRSVHGLIADAGQTHIELKRSREHLLQSEKMAMVGKLAAGMAHSIRNPLTSVKMRLFSLSRSLEMTEPQKEDFAVISHEIRHVDTIVQNFLEFSRPPKLKMQTISPSAVVDAALQLLEHRLRSYEVTIHLSRRQVLPEIEADPEQLKEVLVNLVVNACEAMGHGGHLTIEEEEADSQTLGRAAVIRVCDDGPGIPESIQEKVLQPFYTTKEEGTGLGLSIAVRIVEEHGGWLDLTSTEGRGTVFIITLPVRDQRNPFTEEVNR